MKTLRIVLLAALLLPACDFDVPDLNRPALESIETHPTPSAVEAVAAGLLIGARKGATERVGYVVEWGILGREALVLTNSDPRFVSELLQSSLDPGSNNFGGNFWVIPYANIRGANLLLHALDNPALVGLTPEQKESLRGFAKTFKALDYLQVVDAHDLNGAALNVDQPIGSATPLVTNADQIYSFIEGLLDEAKTHLIGGGAAFPFPLGSGFAGFDTPVKFLSVNRALRARVAVYHRKYGDALTALTASFLDTAQPLTLGAYHAFGAGSGDLPNDLNTPDILAHPSVVTDAEPGDQRIFGPPCAQLAPLCAKVKKLAAPVSLSSHSSGYVFTLYPASNSPIPIIRNEELILLRAEANIGLQLASAGGDRDQAIKDINFIREHSGGLDKRDDLTLTNILDELLKQRRYSLLFEGGHRWIDLRRYGKLDTSHVAIDLTCPPVAPQTVCDVIHPAYPIPLTEAQ